MSNFNYKESDDKLYAVYCFIEGKDGRGEILLSFSAICRICGMVFVDDDEDRVVKSILKHINRWHNTTGVERGVINA